jgi:hypothetical protein
MNSAGSKAVATPPHRFRTWNLRNISTFALVAVSLAQKSSERQNLFGGSMRTKRQWPILVAAVWALSLAGIQGAVALRAAADPPPQAPKPRAAPAASVPVSGSSVLEFDLPDDFGRRLADGTYAVTGFRIGYFALRRSTVLKRVDVPRERVEVNDRTGRISVDFTDLPADANQVVIRLQTLSGGEASTWSESSAPMRLGRASPARGRASPAPGRGAAGAAPRRLQALALADVERHPRVVDALKQTLPSGATIERVLPAFRRIEDLALAAVLCRDHQIVLTALTEKVQGPPRLSLLNALRQLRPDLKPAVIRKGRADALQLLAPPAQ